MSSNSEENKKQDIIDEFLAIAKNYIPINTYKEETSQQYYCECGNFNNCIELQNKIICNECSSVHSIQSIQTSFKDIDRVNLSQKYKYKKSIKIFKSNIVLLCICTSEKSNASKYDTLSKSLFLI